MKRNEFMYETRNYVFFLSFVILIIHHIKIKEDLKFKNKKAMTVVEKTELFEKKKDKKN